MSKLELRLGLIAFLNLFATFFIQWWTLVSVGPGGQTDALYAGLAVPQVVLMVLMGSLTHVLVPLLAGQVKEKVCRDVWGFFLLIGGVFGATSIFLFWLAPLWVPIAFPGFLTDTRQLTVELTRIQLLGMVFSALTAVLLAAHHAKRSFVWPDLAQLAVSVVAIAALVWALPKFGIKSAAWIATARALMNMLLLTPILGKYRSPDWTDPFFRSAWHRLKPLILGTTYYKSGPLVDRYLSSFVAPGGLSILFFAQQIFDTVHTIVNKALATPLMTNLSETARTGEWIRYRHLYMRQVILVASLMTFTVFVTLLIGKGLLHLIVGYGGISANNVDMLWLLLAMMGGYLIGGSVGQPLAMAFYALGDTRTPTYVGVLGFTIGVFLKVLFFYLFGLPGIALGLTVHYLLNAIAMFFLIEKTIKRKFIRLH